eukprot:13766650-Alexandrium_andersonii.AAC.1
MGLEEVNQEVQQLHRRGPLPGNPVTFWALADQRFRMLVGGTPCAAPVPSSTTEGGPNIHRSRASDEAVSPFVGQHLGVGA